MRYLAQRVNTGEWLDRDLPLANVERTRELSGPGSITATIDPELRRMFHTDGLRLLEDWTTAIYAADDNGQVRNCGLVMPPTRYEGSSTQLTCAGFSSYPHGYKYTGARLWGPQEGDGTVGKPEIPRPDPVVIFRDHWEWIQAQQDSDLGVTVVGDLTSNVRIGDYENPYRLRWWEIPDLGQELDTLAAETPFDYVEEHAWADAEHLEVDHRIRLGWPRLGRRRDDLRFADGENIAVAVAAGTSEEYANDVIGIGNGEGRKMVWARATKRDGRLRRTKILTDKTARQDRMDRRVTAHLERLSATLDVESVAIIDHPNARISSIDPGDDIYIQVEVPSYGDVAMWVRVLGIAQDEDEHRAVLQTRRSTAFIYNSTEEVS